MKFHTVCDIISPQNKRGAKHSLQPGIQLCQSTWPVQILPAVQSGLSFILRGQTVFVPLKSSGSETKSLWFQDKWSLPQPIHHKGLRGKKHNKWRKQANKRISATICPLSFIFSWERTLESIVKSNPKYDSLFWKQRTFMKIQTFRAKYLIFNERNNIMV